MFVETMESAHLHLISNHVPVFALVFSVILLVLGELLKNKTLIITALSGFIIAAISSVIAYVSGEEAEHVLESIAGIDVYIEQHEEIAKPANLITVFVGILSIVGISFEIYKNTIPVFIKRLVLLVSLIAMGFISYTAYLGGLIRHTEIRDTQEALINDIENEKYED